MFETYDDDAVARTNLYDVLDQYLENHFLNSEDNPTKLANIRVIDILESVRENYWDDQYDGGAHKDQLAAINMLFIWMGYPERCNDYDQWDALPSDEETEQRYG